MAHSELSPLTSVTALQGAYNMVLQRHFLNWDTLLSNDSSLCQVSIKLANTLCETQSMISDRFIPYRLGFFFQSKRLGTKRNFFSSTLFLFFFFWRICIHREISWVWDLRLNTKFTYASHRLYTPQNAEMLNLVLSFEYRMINCPYCDTERKALLKFIWRQNWGV